MYTPKSTCGNLALCYVAADPPGASRTEFTLHQRSDEDGKGYNSLGDNTVSHKNIGPDTDVTDDPTDDESDSTNTYTSSVATSPLRKRKVLFWEWTDEPRLYNIAVVAENSRFVCVEDLRLSTAVIDSQHNPKFMFKLRHFKCFVEGMQGKSFRIGVTFQYIENNTEYHVCSQLEHGKEIILQKAYPIVNPDERFFLQNETSSKDLVFESLPYLDYCLRFDVQTDDIAMVLYNVPSPFSTPYDPELKFEYYLESEGDMDARSGDKSNTKRGRIHIVIPLPRRRQNIEDNIPDKSELFKLLLI